MRASERHASLPLGHAKARYASGREVKKKYIPHTLAPVRVGSVGLKPTKSPSEDVIIGSAMLCSWKTILVSLRAAGRRTWVPTARDMHYGRRLNGVVSANDVTGNRHGSVSFPPTRHGGGGSLNIFRGLLIKWLKCGSSQSTAARRSALGSDPAESQSERISRLHHIHERLVCKSTEEREHRLDVIRNRLTNETPEQRQHRLYVINERIKTELPFQRTQTGCYKRT
ncbi:hypothetical protein EVAR_91619_1 [Eumeta japonica]|uniref:Uncharacterized protein n=1 Tax=Eumeta variegata TaxID=151549 RepID=A0A4C1UWR3_EUMVA|nr:hypothetical protein EVAR_91619_1 [Eumeta japonica]